MTNPFTFINKPVAFAKKCSTWLVAGFSDRMASRVSGKKISFAKHIAEKVDQCEPWTDHIESSSIAGINQAIKDGDFKSARMLLAIGAKDSKSFCVAIALSAIDFLALGNEVDVSMIPFLE